MNAASFSGANAAERTVSKASGHYKNTEWDLVDAYEDSGGDMEEMELEKSTLPAELKGKTDKEIEAYIQDQQKKRATIQKDILDINTKRQAYIAKQAGEEGNTLDQAIFRAVESLAKDKGFVAKEK